MDDTACGVSRNGFCACIRNLKTRQAVFWIQQTDILGRNRLERPCGEACFIFSIFIDLLADAAHR